MWLFPPPVPSAAAPTQWEGKVHRIFLGGGQLCCPLREPKGTLWHLCLQAWAPVIFLLTKSAKKVHGALLISVRVTLRWHITPLCSSSQPPVKVGRCYKGRLWRVCRHISVAFRHLFTGFLRIKKINQLCCDRISIYILTTVSIRSLNELTNLTAQNNFTDNTGLISTLNEFPWYVCADNLTSSFSVSFLLMWNNPWTMHKHSEWTHTMAQLRSDCSSVCSQLTHCGWCSASQESDRWKYIIGDFAAVVVVKFFTLLHALLENTD